MTDKIMIPLERFEELVRKETVHDILKKEINYGNYISDLSRTLLIEEREEE